MATRLNAILLIPVLVALVMGGFTVRTSLQSWQQADDAKRTARLARAAAAYSHAVMDERDLTVVPLLQGDRNDPAVLRTRAATDEAATVFEEEVKQMPSTPGLERRLEKVRTDAPTLKKVREVAYTRQLPGVQTEQAYLIVSHDLMAFANEVGFGTNNVTSYGRSLYALSLSKSAESLTRAMGTHVLVEDRSKLAHDELAEQLTSFYAYAYLQGIAVEEFKSGGTPADEQALAAARADAEQKGKTQVTEAAQQAQAAGKTFVPPPPMEQMIKAISSGASVKSLKARGITPESWFAASTLGFDAYRVVETQLADKAVGNAEELAAQAKQEAIVNAAAVLLALIAAFIVAGMMARTMSRSMRQLRNAAFDVAEQRLPSLVDQLSRTDPGRVDTRVQPIPISSHDEIGEVARAFDQVHREAVRLAAEQALLRGNVNAIFTNLSLRNQGLIQRQLTLITELENNEADPDQLSNLFKMDHLATRMRRNGENLLVLAGEEPGRRWNQPVPLIDVLRAAASEVEAYERIELVGLPETEIHGSAVTDLVHLLAELLENATSFSSPQTKVRVTATRLPDGRVMVEIHDQGIGLTVEDFADINHKLADPPTVDVEISRRMGLFVVGRLSLRHGIRVQLRPSGELAGTTSLVMLPEPITHGGGGEELREDSDFTVSRIVPEASVQELGYGPTAAELGFDDTRYETASAVPDDARSLDPVGRTRLRDERRAQLEAVATRKPDDRPLFRDETPQRPGGSEQADGTYAHGSQDPNGYQEEQYAQPQTDYDGGPYAPNPSYQETGYAEQSPAFGYEPDWQNQPQQSQEQNYDPNQGQDHGNGLGAPAQATVEGWPQQDRGAQVPHQAQHSQPGPSSGYRGGSDSLRGGPYRAPESVGSPSNTDTGLPRRDRQRQRQQPDPAASESQERASRPEPPQPVVPRPEPDESTWRSTNDEHWQRAEQVREPKAGGVTPSGLPRRVPKANLVPGTATQTPQGGPQVSRAPEDVRGRLSRLRRGVQQGRTAGTDTNGQAPENGYSGPQNQER